MARIVRWNPVREMALMQNTMDRLFNDTFQTWSRTQQTLQMPLDVFETDNGYVVAAALPGADASNIHVSVHDGVLTITGEVAAFTPQGENVRTLVSERINGKFSRALRLPQPVDADNIEAIFENGVLTLNIPKTPEAQPRMIPVRTSNHN